MVLHKCDNRKCVNLEHLYLGTSSQNAIDKVQRFKGKWGFMKLDDAQHLEIVRLSALGKTQQEIAQVFHVHQTAVSRHLRKEFRLSNQENKHG